MKTENELCMRKMHAFGTTLICDREKGHVGPHKDRDIEFSFMGETA